MIDTVTKLMGMTRILEEAAALCADPMTTEAEHEEYVVALYNARQTLQDELTKLFTPLTDEQIQAKWHDGAVPALNFAREIEVLHGITGESK